MDYKLLKDKKISQHQLTKKILAHKFVESASMVTGGHDIIIKVRTKNIAEMDDFVTKYLRNIDGIERSETMIILNEI